jgi:hypothetical protein
MPIRRTHRTQVRRKPALTQIVPIDVSAPQEQLNWCWAACLQAVHGFRDRPTTQCALANAIPRLRGGCCAAPLRKECNEGATPDEFTKLLLACSPGSRHLARALTEVELSDELKNGRPVVIGYTWAHACLVYGRVGNKFLFYDPRGPAPSPPTVGGQSYAALTRYGSASPTWNNSWVGL